MIAPADTLRPDTVLLSALRADSHYDYSRELIPSQDSVWDVVWQSIGRFLNKVFEGFNGGDPTPLFVTIAVLIVIAAVVIIIVKKPDLFFRNSKIVNEQVEDEDNIYGVDFDKEIAVARKKADFRHVVRLVYLQTLRLLADESRIDWRPSKTPTQYTYEFKTGEFQQMTRIFLRVRYGDFPADEALAAEMTTLQGSVRQTLSPEKQEKEAEKQGKEAEDEA